MPRLQDHTQAPVSQSQPLRCPLATAQLLWGEGNRIPPPASMALVRLAVGRAKLSEPLGKVRQSSSGTRPLLYPLNLAASCGWLGATCNFLLTGLLLSFVVRWNCPSQNNKKL